jgi:hypothetical protein
MVTELPALTAVEESDVIDGAGMSTMKLETLAAVPAKFTTEITPVEAVAAETAVIVESFTILNELAAAPLNNTFDAPVKPEPVRVTVDPASP